MSDFSNSGMDSRNLIKLRGLPWDATPGDILDFLKDVEVLNAEKGIYMAVSPRDGRPNGEAFLELANPNDVDKAFSYNKNMLGRRYIEIFNAKPEEFDQCLRRQNVLQHDTFIKLRGLPFSCRLEDIELFFSGLEIRNGKTGIYIVYDSHGRMTGECFVQFRTSDDAENALKRNREKIGHRYIEIFRSSASECRRSTMYTRNMNNSNFGGNGGGGGGGGGIGDGNNRMSGNRPGPGIRNQRNNFRDRPYPDQGGPWNSNSNNDNNHPWRNNSNNNNNNMNRNYGNNGNDNFGGGNSGGGGGSMFNNDSFNDFNDRGWKSNNSNNGGSIGNNNDRGGFGNSSSLFNNDSFNDFNDRNWKSNNSNNNSGNNSDRGGYFNGGGGGGGGLGNSNNNIMGNCGNNGGNNNGGPYLVHLRGMPYDCGEMEIHQFFAPELKLVNCVVLYNNGRHTGEADAYFATVADAQEAMKKHKEKMGSRYIELFANRNSERRGRF